MRKPDAKSTRPSERDRVDRIVQAAQDTKAMDLVLFDMVQRSPLTDHVLICSGRSQAHVRGIAERIDTSMREMGVYCQSIEGYQEGSWVLLDYDVIIVHVFHPETRQYYDLESLLGSFPKVDLPGDPLSP